MTTTLPTPPNRAAGSPTAHLASVTATATPATHVTPATTSTAPAAARRSRWPLLGAAAGVTGIAANMTGIPMLTEEEAATGIGALDHLDRTQFHISFLLGLTTVGLLFFAATGWRRWAERRAPRDLAARTIGAALTATATVNIIFASLAGSMALYMDGGTDEGTLTREGMFVNLTMLDFGQLLGWWGAFVAAACVVALSLRRTRVLPAWMGIVSIVFMLPALGTAAFAALPGLVGLVMPIWLVVISVGLAFSRSADA